MPIRYPHPRPAVAELRAEQEANRAAIAERIRDARAGTLPPMPRVRTVLVVALAAVAGFGAGALITNEPATVPPGAGAPIVFEDGSWTVQGCIPGRICEVE